jgi:hypothetical protein
VVLVEEVVAEVGGWVALIWSTCPSTHHSNRDFPWGQSSSPSSERCQFQTATPRNRSCCSTPQRTPLPWLHLCAREITKSPRCC